MGILRDIGAPGLIIIVLGALLIFGPKRLPELGQSIGKMLAEFKAAVNKTDDDKKDEEDKTKVYIIGKKRPQANFHISSGSFLALSILV